ncbi:hypothetical protein [Methylobacterium sp. CM6247]
MALLSGLVRIVATIEGLEEVSVGIFARHAREAGYISQGGRGRSAAKMSFRDAANLLIAVNGCGLAKEVSEKLPLYRKLPAKSAGEHNVTGLGLQGSTFGGDLEIMLALFSKNSRFEVPGATFIRFYKPNPKVEVRCHPLVSQIEHEELYAYKNTDLGAYSAVPDRSDETVVSHVTMQAVATALLE